MKHSEAMRVRARDSLHKTKLPATIPTTDEYIIMKSWTPFTDEKTLVKTFTIRTIKELDPLEVKNELSQIYEIENFYTALEFLGKTRFVVELRTRMKWKTIQEITRTVISGMLHE